MSIPVLHNLLYKMQERKLQLLQQFKESKAALLTEQFGPKYLPWKSSQQGDSP